jgi:chemotaxis protein methyltransferase CheR
MREFPQHSGADARQSSVDVEDVEVELFITAMREIHGFDYSGYLRASLKRRLQALAEFWSLPSISRVTEKLLHEPDCRNTVVSRLSVPVSELFRDPQVFLRLREEVLPRLASFPRINIWQAGCAGGEEVYSLAILLEELGLSARSHIFATDINEVALARAREGIYPLRDARTYSVNYQQAGGAGSLSDYMHAQYDHVKLDDRLRERVSFVAHNLGSDGVFVEAHLILCRNVLIYFDQGLRQRVMRLFRNSLARNGFLVTGLRERLEPDPALEVLGDGIYRRLADR